MAGRSVTSSFTQSGAFAPATPTQTGCCLGGSFTVSLPSWTLLVRIRELELNLNSKLEQTRPPFFPEIEPSNFHLCLVRAAHSRLRVSSLIWPNPICHISVLLIILSSSPVIPAAPFPPYLRSRCHRVVISTSSRSLPFRPARLKLPLLSLRDGPLTISGAETRSALTALIAAGGLGSLGA